MRVPLDAIESKVDADNRTLLRLLRQPAIRDSRPVYLVGGPVRDLLLDSPIKDLDFVVEGDAPALAGRLAQAAGGEVILHPRFGTATVMLGESRVDLVTARREEYPSPGALPQVTPGTVADDLARRDFSINAMALSLDNSEATLLDPQQGFPDLRQGVIRVLHPASFIDDPTRILRAVRYEQRLGFRFDAATLRQLQQALRQGCLSSISGDRIRHELERILQEWVPYPALARCAELGVLEAIHPALGPGNHLARLSQGLAGIHDPDPLVYWAALAYPLTPGEGESVIHRLNSRSGWSAVIRDTIELRQREPRLAAPGLPPSRYCRLLEGLSIHASLGVSALTESDLVRQRLLEFLETLRFVHPELTGSDLLALGIPPGPGLGQLLRRLKDARLDGQVSSVAEERELVRRFVTPLNNQSDTPPDTPEGGE